jgi:hypothetical protein
VKRAVGQDEIGDLAQNSRAASATPVPRRGLLFRLVLSVTSDAVEKVATRPAAS